MEKMNLPRIPIENWSDKELLSAAYAIISEMETRLMSTGEFAKLGKKAEDAYRLER
jgi:hypothetical protein